MSRRRDPKHTRRELLTAAFEQICRKGFQSASLTDILSATAVTKGALYHHFPDKRHLGLAIIDEVIAPAVRETWVEPLAECHQPLPRLKEIIESASARLGPEDIRLGCPLNNLALEMAPLDEAFRERIAEVYRSWVDVIAAALARGQAAGSVAAGVDTAAAATFIVGAVAGGRGMAKIARSRDVLSGCVEGVRRYLDSLRPEA